MEQGRQFSYRGSHTAPDRDSGAPLHEVGSAMPCYYDHPEWYRTGEHDQESEDVIRAVRGKPDAEVWVHRAVPPTVRDINPGDWVSTSVSYARQHGMDETDPAKDWPVLHRIVRARDLYTSGDSHHEWGWRPLDTDSR